MAYTLGVVASIMTVVCDDFTRDRCRMQTCSQCA